MLPNEAIKTMSMRKNTVPLLFLFLFWFLLSTPGNSQETVLSHYDSLKTMPPFKFYNLQGKAFTPDSLKKNAHRIVIIYFKTSCEFCLSEFKLIKHSMQEFTNDQFILISREETADLKKYDSLRQFEHYPQIRTVQDKDQLYRSWFRASYTPSIHIYDEHHALIRFQDGMLNKEDLLKYLK